MGKLFKDNYASTYAAKNVKQALDKLIDVLQSPEQVRRLVIGSSQGPRKPSNHSKIEAPAKTPLWMETSASMAKPRSKNNSDSEKASTSSGSENNPSNSEKTKMGSSGRRRSRDSSSHISIDRYHQMWAKGLRDYNSDGEQRALPARCRQMSSAAPKLEAGWSSVPCKPGYLDVFVDTLV